MVLRRHGKSCFAPEAGALLRSVAASLKLALFAKSCRALMAAGAVRAVLLAARIAKSRHASTRSGQVKSRHSPTLGGRTPDASVTVSLFLKLLLWQACFGGESPAFSAVGNNAAPASATRVLSAAALHAQVPQRNAGTSSARAFQRCVRAKSCLPAAGAATFNRKHSLLLCSTLSKQPDRVPRMKRHGTAHSSAVVFVRHRAAHQQWCAQSRELLLRVIDGE